MVRGVPVATSPELVGLKPEHLPELGKKVRCSTEEAQEELELHEGDWGSSLVSQLGSGSKGGEVGSSRIVCGEWVLEASEGFCSVKVSPRTRAREADKRRGGGSESS